MKTLVLWLVTLFPTPDCVKRDQELYEKNMVVVGSTTPVRVRFGTVKAPGTKTITVLQEQEPAVDDPEECYETYVAKLEAPAKRRAPQKR